MSKTAICMHNASERMNRALKIKHEQEFNLFFVFFFRIPEHKHSSASATPDGQLWSHGPDCWAEVDSAEYSTLWRRPRVSDNVRLQKWGILHPFPDAITRSRSRSVYDITA